MAATTQRTTAPLPPTPTTGGGPVAIDLFAGAGGFTTGAEAAGARVVWAANHWPLAVDTHARNHPHVTHACQDLHQADWSQVPDHDLLLASPCCQGHSWASRGSRRAYHDASRSTAWAVVSCAEVHRPEVVLVENVPAFRDWTLYPSWADAMRRLGYSLAEHVIDAADLGVPQNRVRLFIVGTRSLAPLRLRLPSLPHRPVLDAIEWETGAWRPVASARGPGVAGRVERGRRNHGPRFLLQHVTNHPGRSLDRPIGTITTAPGHWNLVDGDRMRPLTSRELLAGMGFPRDYALASTTQVDATELIGNAVAPPVARAFVDALRSAA